MSATDHFNTDFATTCKKIPHYSGELMRQMANRLIAQHYFHGVLVHRVKILFGNKLFSDRWLPYILINIYSCTAWCKCKHFHVAWLPSYRFASFSCTIFSFKFYCFHIFLKFFFVYFFNNTLQYLGYITYTHLTYIKNIYNTLLTVTSLQYMLQYL